MIENTVLLSSKTHHPTYLPTYLPAYIDSQTVFDGRLYELRVTCGPDYPVKAPIVRFVSKINLSSVNQQNGTVENSLPALANWSRKSSIENILVSIKSTMTNSSNRRLGQPPEGSMF
jgi:ubiquitin-protein ligase